MLRMKRCVSVACALVLLVLLMSGLSVGALGSAAHDLQSGQKLAEKGDYGAALRIVSQITDPDLAPDVLDLTARCHVLMGDYPRAIAEYNSFLASYPTLKDAREGASSWLALAHFLNKDYAEARDMYESFLSAYPDRAAEWQTKLGCCHQAESKFAEAAKAFTAARDAADKDAAYPLALANDIRSHLGLCLMLTKDFKGAAEAYKALISTCPEQAVEWQTKLGCCYREQGKLADAIKSFESALEVKQPAPDPSVMKDIKVSLAHCYLMDGRNERAQEVYQSVADEYDDGYAKLMACISNAPEADSSRTLSALEDLQSNSKSAEIQALVVINRSRHLCTQGKYDEALALVDEAYEKYPNSRAHILVEKGESLIAAGDHAGAISCLKKMLAEFPNDERASLAVQLLCWSLEKCGRLDEAVEAIESSLPKDATPEQKITARHRIAGIYQNAKKHREAIKVFKEVRKSKDAPDEMRAEAAYQSGLCYKAIRYDNSARICMNEVIKDYPDSRWVRQARGQLYVWGLPKSSAGTSDEGR